MDRAPQGDKVVVMGDLNARVGNNVVRWEGVIGKQGEDVGYDTEHLLRAQLMRYIHKYTWKCPGRGIQSTIDYFLVEDEMKTKENDVKVVRGAEIGSDHHLVVMKVKLHRRVYAS